MSKNSNGNNTLLMSQPPKYYHVRPSNIKIQNQIGANYHNVSSKSSSEKFYGNSPAPLKYSKRSIRNDKKYIRSKWGLGFLVGFFTILLLAVIVIPLVV